MTRKAASVLHYLTAHPRPASNSVNPDPRLTLHGATTELEAQIGLLAENARNNLSSPLVRLPALCEAFGLARSTALKKVALMELPQRVHFNNSRISAYRKVDIDMMLAAQTLATRNGFVLNAVAFVAALSAPTDSVAEVKA